MPTARCSCGQELHYSADKAGLIARCRCGRPVRLPEIEPEPPPKTQKDLFEEEQRAASKRRQLIAVMAVAVAVIIIVSIFVNVSWVSPARPRDVTPAEVEP